MSSQETQNALTLDDIDAIERHLSKIKLIASNGIKSAFERKDLEENNKISTKGYHLQSEIEDEILDIQYILQQYVGAQLEPYHRKDMEIAVRIRELKDKVEVKDCT